eukprot:gene30169-35151_t
MCRRWAKGETGTPEVFHNRTVKDLKEWNNCLAKKGHGQCLRYYNPQQLVKGMYSEFLDDWMANFPRDQLLILRNEDYKVAQEQHMMAVFKFLGVETNLTKPQLTKVMAMEVKNVQKNKKVMLPETRKLLGAFYRPYNQKLSKLMKDDRYLWDYGSTSSTAQAAVQQACLRKPSQCDEDRELRVGLGLQYGQHRQQYNRLA